MSNKVQRLLNKINRSRLGFSTMVNVTNGDQIKIVNDQTMVTVALLNTKTGAVTMLNHVYNYDHLKAIGKLLELLSENL